jgi:hypothetical protein
MAGPASRQAIAGGRRLAAVRPLHGHWRCTSPAWATTPAARGSFGAACRLRAATSSPRPSCRRCSAAPLARQVAQALARAAAPTKCGSSAPAAGALAAQLLGAGRRRCAAIRSSTCPAPCASASASAWRAFGDRVRWLDELPDCAERRGGRQRGARRDAGAAAALGRRSSGSSAASRWHGRPLWPGPTAPPNAAPAGGQRPSCPAP